MIKLENLTKQFVQKKGQPLKAVDNVNLNVPEGEMCVLLGPSGCGKTTTLKMINRLIAPSSGNILINGENTNDMDTVTLRRNKNEKSISSGCCRCNGSLFRSIRG